MESQFQLHNGVLHAHFHVSKSKFAFSLWCNSRVMQLASEARRRHLKQGNTAAMKMLRRKICVNVRLYWQCIKRFSSPSCMEPEMIAWRTINSTLNWHSINPQHSIKYLHRDVLPLPFSVGVLENPILRQGFWHFAIFVTYFISFTSSFHFSLAINSGWKWKQSQIVISAGANAKQKTIFVMIHQASQTSQASQRRRISANTNLLCFQLNSQKWFYHSNRFVEMSTWTISRLVCSSKNKNFQPFLSSNDDARSASRCGTWFVRSPDASHCQGCFFFSVAAYAATFLTLHRPNKFFGIDFTTLDHRISDPCEVESGRWRFAPFLSVPVACMHHSERELSRKHFYCHFCMSMKKKKVANAQRVLKSFSRLSAVSLANQFTAPNPSDFK